MTNTANREIQIKGATTTSGNRKGKTLFPKIPSPAKMGTDRKKQINY